MVVSDDAGSIAQDRVYTRDEVRIAKDAAKFRKDYTPAAWVPTYEDACRVYWGMKVDGHRGFNPIPSRAFLVHVAREEIKTRWPGRDPEQSPWGRMCEEWSWERRYRREGREAGEWARNVKPGRMLLRRSTMEQPLYDTLFTGVGSTSTVSLTSLFGSSKTPPSSKPATPPALGFQPSRTLAGISPFSKRPSGCSHPTKPGWRSRRSPGGGRSGS